MVLYDPGVPPLRRRLVVVYDGRESAVARVVDSYASTACTWPRPCPGASSVYKNGIDMNYKEPKNYVVIGVTT